MSALFLVSVQGIHQDKVDLRLTIINPEQRSFYDTKSFAVLLLLDPLHGPDRRTTRLTDEIPLQHVLISDLELVRKKESRIVGRVELHDVVHYPVDPKVEDLSDEAFRLFWAEGETRPQAILTITVKSPRFLDHLVEGQTWKSSAFHVN